jgi:hypothetical protein
MSLVGNLGQEQKFVATEAVGTLPTITVLVQATESVFRKP